MNLRKLGFSAWYIAVQKRHLRGTKVEQTCSFSQVKERYLLYHEYINRPTVFQKCGVFFNIHFLTLMAYCSLQNENYLFIQKLDKLEELN